MDFAALPPEINSGRMYSGPGSGPMMEAASGLAKPGRGTVLGGGVLLFGGHRPDRRQLAGPRVGIDGGRGGDLCRMDECRRR